MKKLKEIICVLFGHKWNNIFDPREELKRPINERTFCKRCGVKYHKHEYQTKK